RPVAVGVREDVDADEAGMDDGAVRHSVRHVVRVAGAVRPRLATDGEVDPAGEDDAPLRAVRVLREIDAVGDLVEHREPALVPQHPSPERGERAVDHRQGPDELGEELLGAHAFKRPPSTTICAPLTYEERSDARK